ncbi:hypothetical protein BKA70DRAFT_40662 [Coprinopsis sp. MPI-PUGE-AT-0042]|nr:hypothetical protein BKA70DRAFT_40662 [Coprinopsis sp. MPI-PUGE-AT-0042]
MMSEMPLDILHEIFKYLEPYDLLRLARTTRALRAILMRPYAKEIWHSSFATIQGPFPPCPDDLNEPQWANLMFSNHCHECGIEPSGKRGTLFMFMEARTQLCAKCSQKKFLKWQDLPVKIPESLQIITPATTKAFKKGRGSRSKLNKFHLDTALEMFNQYTRFGGDLARRNAWFQQQRANCDKVSEHAALCEEYVRWAEEEAKKRRQAEKGDFTQVKEKRFNAICSRLPQWLDEIGFTESDEIREMEDLAVPNFFHHELVNVPVELTDNEWERIRPQLVDWLERVVRPKCILFNSLVAMEGRIRRWVSLVYVNWAVLQLNALPLPSLSEVVLMEEFRAPLENNDLVDEVIIEAAMDALQAFVDKWRRSKEEELLTIVRNSSVYSAPGAEEVDRGTLLLASTAFLCRTCAQTFIYPSILTHGCRTAGDETMEAFKALRTSLGLPDDGPSPSFIGPSNQSQTDNQYPRGFVPWRAVSWFGILRVNSQRIQFSDTAYHHTRALLRQCDMPYTTTHVELKEADPHFQVFRTPSQPKEQLHQVLGCTLERRCRSSHRSCHEHP